MKNKNATVPSLSNTLSNKVSLNNNGYISGITAGTYSIANTTTSISANGMVQSYGGMGSSLPKGSPPATPIPADWKQIKIYSDNEYYTQFVNETPVNGKQAWIASLTISTPAGVHHWTVFKKLHPDVKYLICGVAEDDDGHDSMTQSNIIFPTEQDFNIFEQWFAQYVSEYQSIENLYSYKIPPPPKALTKMLFVEMGNHGDIVDFHVWMMNNCQDRFYMLGGGLLFTNEEDAVSYRLKFK